MTTMMMKFLLLFVLLLATGCHGGKPLSSVVELTTDNFRDMLEDPANGLFLIKFYAPWCGHCKRLAPILEEVAPQVAGQMAIGTIDCTTQKPLCNEHSVKAFPTLKFYKDGMFFDYPGGRKAQDIKSFARKMSKPAIAQIATYEAAVEVAGQNDPSVAFLLYDTTMDKSETKLVDQLQSTPMGRVYNQVARKQQAMANFLVWDGEAADVKNFGGIELPSTPFVVKIEQGVDPVFWAPSTEETISSVGLIQFVKENNLNLVSEFGPSNFHRIGQIGRQLVIGAVDGKDETQVERMVQQLTQYAKTGLQKGDYYFGWMDGKTWHKFLEQFHVRDLPQVFVLHVPTKTFYQNETYAFDVAAFLTAIDTGVLPKLHRSTDRGWKGLANKAQNTFLNYMPYSLVALLMVCIVVVLLVVPPAEDLRPPYNNNNNNNAGSAGDDLTQAETETFDDEPPTTTTAEQQEAKKDK